MVALVGAIRQSLPLPTDEDLKGAAIALLRLQDMYRLDVHQLADGQLLGKRYSRPLTGKVNNFNYLLRTNRKYAKC